MKSQKVAIIGAGIIGLYLAWQLSKKGHQVTIFEKKKKIGKEACSGLFSERILKFIPSSRKLIQNQIRAVLIHFPQKTLRIKFSKKFLVINHAALDRLVADLAKKTGAKIILQKPISSLPQGFDRIIGCDGACSFVRKKLRLPEPSYRLGIQGFVAEKNSADYVETWPVNHGFIWQIPRGKETEYGIIAQPQTAQKLFKEFSKRRKLQLARVNSAIISQGLLIPKNSSMTLCGEAAGLTKPWSGGGVVWGLIAADIFLKSFPNFLKYHQAMKKYFLPKIILSKTATKLAYWLGFKTPWLLPKNLKIESDFLF